MKIIKLTIGAGFSVQEDLGILDSDFITKSFFEQVLPHLKTLPYESPSGNDQTYLIFDQQDEACLMALLKQLAGGMISDRSMGHITQGEIVVLNKILEPLNRRSIYVPRHFGRDGEKPIAEIKDWSLALQ